MANQNKKPTPKNRPRRRLVRRGGKATFVNQHSESHDWVFDEAAEFRQLNLIRRAESLLRRTH